MTATSTYRQPDLTEDGLDTNGVRAMCKVRAQIELRRHSPDLAKVRRLLDEVGFDAVTSGAQQTNADALATWAEMLLAAPEPWTSEQRQEFEQVLRGAETNWFRVSPTLVARMHQLDAERWLRDGDADKAMAALGRADGRVLTTPDLRVHQAILVGRVSALRGKPDEALRAFATAAREVRSTITAQRLWAVTGGAGDFQRRFDLVLGEAARTWVQWSRQAPDAAQAALPVLYEVVAGFHGCAEIFDELVFSLRQGAIDDPNLEAQYRDIQAEIERLQRHVPLVPVRRIATRKALQAAVARHRQIEAHLALRATPTAGPAQSATSTPLSAIRAALRDGELLLEFARTDTGYLLIGSTRQESWTEHIATDAGFAAAVAALTRPEDEAAFTAGLGTVSARILNDTIAARCAAATSLLVSPDAEIASIPFAALPFRGAPLIERMAVTFMSSGLHLARGRQLADSQTAPPADSWTNGKLLAFGNPRYPPNDQPHPERTRCGTVASELPALPGTAKEVLQVARLFATTEELPSLQSDAPATLDTTLSGRRFEIYLGDTARESALGSACKDPVRFLHFACHGAADREAAELSFLALTMRSDSPEQGLLRVPEFGSLRGDYELVALSACQTSVGPIHGREGPASLARAALANGARRVLATLWRIGDDGACDLVVDFYRNWHANQAAGASVALRTAQLTASARGRPAREWAAFTLWGEPR